MLKLMKHILKDLTKDRHRAVLSASAMTIGMTAFGIISFCYTIIIRELPKVFDDTNTASGVLTVDGIDHEVYETLDE